MKAPVKFKDHNSLCLDLAKTKNTIYVEVPLGSVWGGQTRARQRYSELLDEAQGSDVLYGEERAIYFMETRKRIKDQIKAERISTQIADVIVFYPSYTKFNIDIFEVKKTRQDFLSDIRTEKWKGYLKYSNRFYFACLRGICTKDEIPEGVGLYVRGDKGWSCIKGAKTREIEYSMDMLLASIFYRQRQNRTYQHRSDLAFQHDFDRRLKKLGKEVNIGHRLYKYTSKKIDGIIWDVVKDIFGGKINDEAYELADKYGDRVDDVLEKRARNIQNIKEGRKWYQNG